MAMQFTTYVREEEWFAAPHNLQVGASIGGVSQDVATGQDRWRAIIEMRVPATARGKLRAWMTRRRGRLISDDMGPVRDLAGAPSGSVAFSDGAFFNDGAGFATGATVGATLEYRGTTLQVDDPNSATSWAEGAFFGLYGRLYQITNVRSVNGSTVLVDFWPRARHGGSIAATVDYPPRAPMRLASNDPQAIRDEVRGAIDLTLELEETTP